MNDIPFDLDNKIIDEQDEKEIAELSMFAARTLARTYREMSVKFSSIDEKFLAKCFSIMMKYCENGTTIDANEVIKQVSNFDDFKNKRISKVAKQEVLIFAKRFPEMLALHSSSLKV